MSDTKTKAIEIYLKHIALASQDGTLFRRTVREEMINTLGISGAAASTHYNTAKKLHPVEGLGRATVTKGARKVTANKGKAQDVDDSECYTVIEIVNGKTGRTRSYLTNEEATKDWSRKCRMYPKSGWRVIKGLGPNPGDDYELGPDEVLLLTYAERTGCSLTEAPKEISLVPSGPDTSWTEAFAKGTIVQDPYLEGIMNRSSK